MMHRHWKRYIRFYQFALIIFLLFFCKPIFGSEKDGAGGKKTLVEEWGSTLRFGVSDQVLDVIRSIRAAKETALNAELETVLSTTIDQDVKKTIVDYFIETGFVGAEGFAVAKLGSYDEEDKVFIIQLWRYLGSIRSEQVATLSPKFIDLADDGLSIAAIGAIGKVKDASKGKMLLGKLLDDEFPQARKTQIIFTLGEIPFMDAVPALIAIVLDKEKEVGLRMYACEALGKMKEKSAVAALKKLFTENNALLKVYAAAALSAFDMSEVVDLLMEGLKDSNWKVRVESAKALAKKDASKALDILIWKVKNDEVKDVRIESMRALAEIGTKKSFDLLRLLAVSETEVSQIREIAFDLCVNKDTASSLDTVKAIIAKEWDKPADKQRFLELAAGYLASVKSPLLTDFYSKFMDSKNLIIRAYGIRGAAANNAGILRKKISDLAANDPVPSVRREAEVALGKL